MVGRLRAGRGVGVLARLARGVDVGVSRSSPSVAFVRYWAAGRMARWFVLVFGAKWFSAGSLRLAGARQQGICWAICDFALVGTCEFWWCNCIFIATRRAAGSSEHAHGPAARPFLAGPRGEVAVREALGHQPACTSGVNGGCFITLWDDGIPACSPPGGRAAAVPSDPGPSGGLVCSILAGGLLTTSDDGSGDTVDDGWLPGERGPTRASGRRAVGGSNADGGGAETEGGWSADKFVCLFW